MKKRKLISRTIQQLGIILVLLAWAPSSFAESKPMVLQWDQLIPQDWNPNSVFDKYSDEELDAMSDEEYYALQFEAQVLFDSAPTVESLDGEVVQISGYMLPLEFNLTNVTEFLLVPYFGACVHSPPPLANQIIHGTLATDYTMGKLFEPVSISGTLKTVRAQKELGESGLSQTINVDTGYAMEVEEVTLYQWEE